MTSKEIANDLRIWLDENGYEDFYINRIIDIKLTGKRIIPKEDIKEISDKYGINFKRCEINYDSLKKDEILNVEYRFEDPEIKQLKNQITNWLNDRGLYFGFSVFIHKILLYSHSELSKEVINDFEDDFNVRLSKAKFEYRSSFGVCEKTRVHYDFSRN